MFNELNSMLYEVLGDCNKALSENIELKKEIAWFKKYTDALVEHKDMVCLPADLKNLRESNATLATENEKLKKIIKRYRNDSNVMLEPTDEEVTKTFMDKQANPKDIEFDGDELVASVEEAASKLKSIKEHNNRFTKEIGDKFIHTDRIGNKHEVTYTGTRREIKGCEFEFFVDATGGGCFFTDSEVAKMEKISH